MFEYDIKRFNRRCAKTDREFKPGDVYYSALVEQGDAFVRVDISAAAWEGPPEGAIGWWRCQMAPLNPHRVYWAPSNVLVDYFAKLAQSAAHPELCYLMSLVLLRKKLLQMVENRMRDDGAATMLVHAPRLKQDFSIPICEPPLERLRQLETELCEQLFTDQPLDLIDAESAKEVETH